MESASDNDQELEKVVAAILKMDPRGERTGIVIRKTLDQLYDGQRTGRYRWDQLHKTEKTHCGTLVEINLHREFEFKDGQSMDYLIEGVEVDCKYSQSNGGWMIPLEAMDHLCLLLTADDPKSKWNMGIVRINDALLNTGGNRDSKRYISAAGRSSIRWIFADQELPPNILLQLPRQTVDALMKLRSGQQRVNQIFRIAQNQRIGRGVIATVAMQEDYMKRIRGNGGARSQLAKEGIIILGQFAVHKKIAAALGVPIPQFGESVSVRVAQVPAIGVGTVELEGKLWRVANPDDPVLKAPKYPHK